MVDLLYEKPFEQDFENQVLHIKCLRQDKNIGIAHPQQLLSFDCVLYLRAVRLRGLTVLKQDFQIGKTNSYQSTNEISKM